MKKCNIPLTVPNLTGNEKKYLDDCIDTTFVSSVGEYVNRFEKMVAEVTGSNEAVATSCGTTGLHAALTAVGVKHGELVIIPSFTFIATANAVHHCGADPWMMDICEKDWCLDPDIVRAQIKGNCGKDDNGQLIHTPSGRRVAALMPVYTIGSIPDMEAFRAIADEYDLPLVVDAACAIGAKYKGKDFGPLADLSVLSFNGNKTVTCGGGGAVVGNDKTMTDRVRHLTTTARIWPDYDFDEAGFNYRMTNIQAAVGCAQMERLNEFVESKQNTSRLYKKIFSEKGIDPFATTDGSSCWFSGIVLPESKTYDDVKVLCGELKDKGIEAKPFWKPVHLQKPYQNCPKSDMSVAESLWQRLVTLPCSTGITEDEIRRVCDAVIAVCA